MSANSSTGEVRSFGQMYFVRKSVQQILQSVAQSPGSRAVASSSSSSSSSATSRPTKDRPKPRLCLYWDLVNDYDVVLLMATFNGINPMVKQGDGGSIIPNVPFETLLKHLVSIFPTSSIPGRRSINMEFIDSSNERRTEHQENLFLILAPVFINTKDLWGRKYDGFFSNEDLCYIRQLLNELEEERFRNKVSNLELVRTKPSPSSNSTIPKSRVAGIDQKNLNRSISDDEHEQTGDEIRYTFSHEIEMTKTDFVLQWLNKYGGNPFDDSASWENVFFIGIQFLSWSLIKN